MPAGPPDQSPHREAQLAYRFGVAWVFLLVGASVGALLRLVALAPQRASSQACSARSL
ncbi:MAG: hypothetical protein IPL39_13290 [Opitutaceae bacterium]|nr:hypothetical protein [Opitutaceae bacterium]